jgi:hypothetical protein
MKKEDLKKKLSERSPLSPTRPIITPVDLYDVPKENEHPEENKTDEKSHNRTFAQSHQNTIVRINRGYKLREDIIKDLKNLAVNSNKKLYEVMEEAMLDYLKKHRT